MAAGGYPGAHEKGKTIAGLDAAAKLPDVMVFHAGAIDRTGAVVTSGGRVLGVTALGPSLQDAQRRAYQAVDQIHFENAYCRRDIAAKGIEFLKTQNI